jgi:hypothetical protein
MAEYKKAIVAAVGAVVAIAAAFGTDIDPEASTTAITILTAVAVWYFRNEAPEAKK